MCSFARSGEPESAAAVPAILLPISRRSNTAPAHVMAWPSVSLHCDGGGPRARNGGSGAGRRELNGRPETEDEYVIGRSLYVPEICL